MGGHAIMPIDGNVSLCYAEGGEYFNPMDGGEPEIVAKGEVIYKDEKEVLTRRWVWRQSNKDKVTVDTTSIFIPIDIMEGLSEELCERIIDDVEESLKHNGYGRIICKDIISRKKLSTEINI
jgi:lysyl-tRNA synthetase class 2